MAIFEISDTSTESFTLIFNYFICSWVIHGCCAFLSSYFGVPVYREAQQAKEAEGRKVRSRQIVWNYTCASSIYATLISLCYLHGSLEFYETAEKRWTASSPWIVHGISFHVGSNIYECACYAMSDKEPVFYLHHAVTIICVGSMLFTRRAQFWCCILGLVEASNVPLSLLTILGASPTLKKSILFTLNGVLLWLSYALLRVPIPYAMYHLAKDLRTEDVAYVFEDPTYHMVWVGGIFGSAGFLWLLSMFWFEKITKGVLKALGFGGDSTKDAPLNKGE